MNELEKIKEELLEIIEMIESDIKITGKYEMNKEAKKYALNIKDDLQTLLKD